MSFTVGHLSLQYSISPPACAQSTIYHIDACDNQDTINIIMHVCTAFPPVNSTKDTYVVMDFSACISTMFYNNIFDNIAMFNWQVGPRSLPPPQTVVGMYVLLGKCCGCSFSLRRHLRWQKEVRPLPAQRVGRQRVGRLPPP